MSFKWFKTFPVFLFFLPVLLVSANTFSCNSCESCNQMIENAKPGDTVTLTSDISSSGNCIVIDKAGITFDCQGHTISDSDSGTGIQVSGDNVNVKNCGVKKFEYGINVNGSNSLLENNTAKDNSIIGIRLIDSSNHTLTGNLVEDNFLFGVLVYNVTNSSFTNNTVTGSLEAGISIADSKNNTLKNNTVSGNKVRGISLRNSTGNAIDNNNISHNQIDGIGLQENSSGNKIRNNTMRFNGNQNINPLDKSSEDNEIEYQYEISGRISQFKEAFTQLLEIPVLSTVFSNERINFYVNEKPEGYIVIRNSQIVDFGEDELSDQSMNVHITEEAIDKIAKGETTVEEALKDGEIRYEGAGFLNSLRIGIYSFFFNVYSFFTGLGS